MNTNTMNNMNKNLKAVTLAFLVLSLSFFSSCSGAGDLEGKWDGKAKIIVSDPNTFKKQPETQSNMSFVITTEKDTSTVQIKDKATGKECTFNGIFNSSTKAINFLSSESLKNCELVVDGVPYKLENYTVSGHVGEYKGEMKNEIKFHEKARKNDVYELDFEGTRTK